MLVVLWWLIGVAFVQIAYLWCLICLGLLLLAVVSSVDFVYYCGVIWC